MAKTAFYRRDLQRVFAVPRDGAHRLLHDIWQPLALLVLAICFTIVIFTTDPGAAKNVVFYCNADGKIKKRGDRSYKPLWDPEQFFTVNVAYGSMPFSVAKFIDACWDVVIGRGGQVLVAAVAYRVLRGSLTLIMETCEIPVPMTTTTYCRGITLASVWETLRCSVRPRGRRARGGIELSGKLRLMAHLFVCVYVLAFATLASVVTGYRAGLTGYFGFKDGETSQLKPVTKISEPLVSLYDGNRIGLSDEPIHLTSFLGSGKVDLGAKLNDSSRMGDLTGTLFDYYYTCLGLLDDEHHPNASRSDGEGIKFLCADHDCSCPLSNGYKADVSSEIQVAQMKSTITVDGKQWDLPAPPLSISLILPTSKEQNQSSEDVDAGYYWSGIVIDQHSLERRAYINKTSAQVLTLFDNGAEIEQDLVTNTGACIANDAYQWGFSSLLVLTFCSYTLLFAATLIGLQVDVFMNSRSDRTAQSYSIYHDVLFLAAELKAMFGEHAEELSAKEIDDEVAYCDAGFDLEVDELLPARACDWKLSSQGKATRKKFVERRPALEDAVRWLADQGLSFEPLEPMDLEALEARSAAPTPGDSASIASGA